MSPLRAIIQQSPVALKKMIETLMYEPISSVGQMMHQMTDPVLGGLTEVIILCVKCLQAFSPNLVDLICEPEFSASKWEPIFEISFGAPKLSENAIHLTFGTVLSIVGVYTKVLNLQNYAFHEIPLNKLPEIELKDSTNTTTNPNKPKTSNVTARPFSKSLSVASVSSVNCPPNELLANLDGELCLMALEHILTLAASQSMLALKNSQLPVREKQLIKREISSELLSYHEYVRRKVLIEYREHNKIWHRRKQGQVLMQEVEDSQQATVQVASTSQPATTDVHKRPSTELRVNVVRRLHLQQHKTPATAGSFEMSQIISPIVSKNQQQQPAQTSSEPIASTPHLARPALRRSGDAVTNDLSKRVHISEDIVDSEAMEEEEEEITLFPPEEPKYSPLSYIQFIEEDYLHFMSNLFFVICQNE